MAPAVQPRRTDLSSGGAAACFTKGQSMTTLLPHHDGSSLYVSNLAPSLGDVVTVRLRVPEGYGPLAAVRTRSNPDHEPEWTDAVRLGTIDGWEWWEAPVTVRNPRHGYRWLLVHEAGPDGSPGAVEWLNQTGCTRSRRSTPRTSRSSATRRRRRG